jgi:hypothetical protein
MPGFQASGHSCSVDAIDEFTLSLIQNFYAVFATAIQALEQSSRAARIEAVIANAIGGCSGD